MANNRMYLRCRHCGKTLMLAKYYPGTGYYLFEINESKSKAMDDFFQIHKYCYQDRDNKSFEEFNKDYPLPPIEETFEENNFDIVYEFKVESEE